MASAPIWGVVHCFTTAEDCRSIDSSSLCFPAFCQRTRAFRPNIKSLCDSARNLFEIVGSKRTSATPETPGSAACKTAHVTIYMATTGVTVPCRTPSSALVFVHRRVVFKVGVFHVVGLAVGVDACLTVLQLDVFDENTSGCALLFDKVLK